MYPCVQREISLRETLPIVWGHCFFIQKNHVKYRCAVTFMVIPTFTGLGLVS